MPPAQEHTDEAADHSYRIRFSQVGISGSRDSRGWRDYGALQAASVESFILRQQAGSLSGWHESLYHSAPLGPQDQCTQIMVTVYQINYGERCKNP